MVEKGERLRGQLLNASRIGRFVGLPGSPDAVILLSTIEAGGWETPEALGLRGHEIDVVVDHVGDEKQIRVRPAEPGPSGIASREELLARLRVGSRVTGRLLQTSQSLGRFIDLGYDLHGLMYIGNLQDSGIRDPQTLGPLGTKITVEVISIEEGDRVRLVPCEGSPVSVGEPEEEGVAADAPPESEPSSKATDVPEELAMIVDGSNVVRVSGVARYEHLRTALERLRERFPCASIVVVVDANLRHILRENGDSQGVDRLEKDIREGRVYQAPSRRDADEYILDYAGAKDAVVVSGDRFEKHAKERPGIRLLKPMWIADFFSLPKCAIVHRGSGSDFEQVELPS